MRIISLLNVSNVDDLSCDSGLTFQKLILQELQKIGHEVHLILPNSNKIKSYYMENVKIHYLNMGETKYKVRYYIDWDGLISILKEVEPDIILNNQIELSPSIRAIFESSHLNIKLMSYCHYLPFYFDQNNNIVVDSSLNDGFLCYPIILSIISACIVSEFIFVQSEFARNQLCKAIAMFSGNVTCQIVVIEPPIDDRYLEKVYFDTNETERYAVYNHRLYEQYGTAEAVTFFKLLTSKLYFPLVVCDPMPNRSKERNRKDDSVSKYLNLISSLPMAEIFSEGNDRKKYFDKIKNCYFGIAAFRKAAVWSMSVMDLLSMGKPVIAPKYAVYPEFLPEYLLFNSMEEAIIISNKLIKDEKFYRMAVKDCLAICEKYTPAKIAEKFVYYFDTIRDVELII